MSTTNPLKEVAMMNRFCVLIGVYVVLGVNTMAQTPQSFFPHHVGDRWDYVDSYSGHLSSVITRDSVDSSGSHHISYGHSSNIAYKIDTALNVYWLPQDPFINYLRYKLAADSGETWQSGGIPSLSWARVARIESIYVFGIRTVVKVYRYNPGPGPGWLEERWLASRFGLVYTYGEPDYVSYLRGCVIAGDTFGILTSVAREKQPIPKNYILGQNYPNPFNPTTTISLEIPEHAILSVRIFDLLGREIEVLAEGIYARGVYKFSWNASASPSGVYFCRMRANGNVRTIKMLLSK